MTNKYSCIKQVTKTTTVDTIVNGKIRASNAAVCHVRLNDTPGGPGIGVVLRIEYQVYREEGLRELANNLLAIADVMKKENLNE